VQEGVGEVGVAARAALLDGSKRTLRKVEFELEVVIFLPLGGRERTAAG